MKVRIAFVTKPGSDEIDVDRIGAIEDHPVDDARRLIAEGIAAEPTADELDNWDADVERRLAAEDADLSTLTIKQLRDQYPAAAAMPVGTRKDDLIAAVEDARRAELGGEPNDTDEVPGAVAEPVTDTADSQ